MKKYLIVLISILACSTGIAQPICEDVVVTTDDFTKVTSKKIRVKMSNNLNNASLIGIKTSDDQQYLFSINYKSTGYHSVVEGDPVMVMMEDSTIMNFVIKFTDISESVLDYKIITIFFNANRGDVVALADKKWSRVRFYTAESYEEFEIKEKNAIELSGAINCMLKK